MDPSDHWPRLKKLFRRSLFTSMHYALATSGPDGRPHVTPIGSLILTEPGKGFYFEIFTKRMPDHFEENQKVCVMAVHSGIWPWFRALLTGRFAHPPAVRLQGLVGARREATEAEMKRWRKRVRWFRWFKGYNLLWNNLRYVRDIEFKKVDPVQMGPLTRGLWRQTS